MLSLDSRLKNRVTDAFGPKTDRSLPIRSAVALELADAITDIVHSRVSDEVYAPAKSQFRDDELVTLVLAVATINAWNRLTITFGSVPATMGDALAENH